MSVSVTTGQTLNISSGQVSSGLVDLGTVNVLSGGEADDTTILSGGSQHIIGTASGTIVSSSGFEFVAASGIATSTVLLDFGFQNVLAGGTAFDTVVSANGHLNVLGVASGAVVSFFGDEIVSSGGSDSGSTILSGGFEQVNSGGLASGTEIDSGGVLHVISGGMVSAPVISGGTLHLDSSSLASGGITFAGGGGEIIFDHTSSSLNYPLKGAAPGDTLDLNDIPFDSNGTVSMTSDGILHVTESSTSVTVEYETFVNFAFLVADNGSGGIVISISGATSSGQQPERHAHRHRRHAPGKARHAGQLRGGQLQPDRRRPRWHAGVRSAGRQQRALRTGALSVHFIA
jgi:autotransporter passenger strand-loop-strand repeat protein